MGRILLRRSVLLLCGVIFLGSIGCEESVRQSASNETYYLKYDFHYTTEKGLARGSIANYTKMTAHQILPYGSQVRIESYPGGFILVDQQSGRKIEVLATSKYLDGKSLSEYLDLILSKTPVSYTGLSEIDMKGISEGKPYKGMSKKGVMIALGYPCPHMTPSPDADTWYYWKNRFRSYAVRFENGIVVSTGY